MALWNAEVAACRKGGQGLMRGCWGKAGNRLRDRDEMAKGEGTGKGVRGAVGAEVGGREAGGSAQAQHYVFQSELVHGEGFAFADRGEVTVAKCVKICLEIGEVPGSVRIFLDSLRSIEMTVRGIDRRTERGIKGCHGVT